MDTLEHKNTVVADAPRSIDDIKKSYPATEERGDCRYLFNTETMIYEFEKDPVNGLTIGLHCVGRKVWIS